MDDPVDVLTGFMGAEDAPVFPCAVACSGGADSTALLHAAQRCWPGRVVALHVHHGLQSAADDFVAQVRSSCDGLGVPLHVARVDARHASGESPEDAARRARYAALAGLAAQHGLARVLLAQHADDQIETLLLALSRGAGLPGLAAMPARFERHGMAFQRPWLTLAGGEIRDWLQRQGGRWVEDPSNADLGLTRNRIRRQLLPALEAAFPSFRETFARSVRHVAQAQSLLDDLAAQDLREVGNPPRVAALQGLSTERLANTLRHWLRQAHGVMPSTAQLDALVRQIRACTTRGHGIDLKVGSGFVRRQGDALAWYNS